MPPLKYLYFRNQKLKQKTLNPFLPYLFLHLECLVPNFPTGKIVTSFGVKNEDANNGNKSLFKTYRLANRAAGQMALVQINSKQETNRRTQEKLIYIIQYANTKFSCYKQLYMKCENLATKRNYFVWIHCLFHNKNITSLYNM